MGKLFDENGKLIDRDGLKSVQLGPVIHGGYSPAVGEYVASEADFKDKLARKSDAMSARMGFDVDFQPADRGDASSLGVTTDR